MKVRKDWQAASIEAAEEAGIRGRVSRKPIGAYTYWRRADHDFRLTSVNISAFLVKKQNADWKEEGQRDARWLDVLNAVDTGSEPALNALIVR